jgi:hypothetical protein
MNRLFASRRNKLFCWLLAIALICACAPAATATSTPDPTETLAPTATETQVPTRPPTQTPTDIPTATPIPPGEFKEGVQVFGNTTIEIIDVDDAYLTETEVDPPSNSDVAFVIAWDALVHNAKIGILVSNTPDKGKQFIAYQKNRLRDWIHPQLKAKTCIITTSDNELIQVSVSPCYLGLISPIAGQVAFPYGAKNLNDKNSEYAPWNGMLKGAVLRPTAP